MRIFTDEDRAKAAEAAKAKAAEELTYQSANTRIIDKYTVRPTLRRGQGNEYYGWEVTPPANQGVPWYFATEKDAIESVPRHIARYS